MRTLFEFRDESLIAATFFSSNDIIGCRKKKRPFIKIGIMALMVIFAQYLRWI